MSAVYLLIVHFFIFHWNEGAFNAFLTAEKLENSSEIDSLIVENAMTTPTEITEVLQKQFNEVYYSTILKDSFNLTEGQKNEFYQIANSCPIINSRAVFGARAVVKRFNDTLEYNDADLCDQAGYTYKVAQAKPVFSGITCKLYPNPSIEKTNISFSKIPDGITKIRITDIQGKVVLEKEEQLNVGQVEIVTSLFPAGLYNVQVFVNKFEIFQTKLEVSR